MKKLLFFLLLIIGEFLYFSCQKEDSIEYQPKLKLEEKFVDSVDNFNTNDTLINNNIISFQLFNLEFSKDYYNNFFISFRNKDQRLFVVPRNVRPVIEWSWGGVIVKDTLSYFVVLGTFEMRLTSFDNFVFSLEGHSDVSGVINSSSTDIFNYFSGFLEHPLLWLEDENTASRRLKYDNSILKKRSADFYFMNDKENDVVVFMNRGIKCIEIITRNAKGEVEESAAAPTWVRKKLVGASLFPITKYYFSFVEDTIRYEFGEDTIGKCWVDWHLETIIN